MGHPNLIYKILTAEQWQSMQEAGILAGAPIDLQDGYIHFSTAQQTAETLSKHFTGQSNLELLEVQTDSVAEHLKWETSRNDQLFPHLYAKLKIENVNRHWTITTDQEGGHQLPRF